MIMIITTTLGGPAGAGTALSVLCTTIYAEEMQIKPITTLIADMKKTANQ